MWRSKDTMTDVLNTFDSYDSVIVFDTETTGFNAEKDRIIQLSGQKYRIENGELILSEEFDHYINPERTLPSKITEITGITDEMLNEAKTEDELFEEIKEFFGTFPLVAYNSGFDCRFMTAMYLRHGCEFSPAIVLDVLEMARDIVKKNETANFKLETMATLYGVNADLTFHNSMDDVTATARLLQIFYNEYKDREALGAMLLPTKRAKIFGMHYWPGFKGMSRIYLQTNLGTFYYDIRSKSWDKKPDNPIDIREVDMERLRIDAWALANATNDLEFARYRG